MVAGTSRLARTLVSLAAVTITALGCGGDSPAGPSPGGGGNSGGGSGGGPTITITASGVSPKTLTISRGMQVTFVNNDNRLHQMNSNPHPTHGDCQEIDAVGSLAAGSSRQSGNFNTARTCGYHDHNQPTSDAMQGTIVIQ